LHIGIGKEIIMLNVKVDGWVTEVCPSGSTHALKGSFFANSGFNAQGATGLFCYNRTTGTGAFFATGKHDPRDKNPHKVGENHTFIRQWTHLVHIPILSFVSPLPRTYTLLLFYDAASGEAEIYETDGRGHLELKKRHNGWRTSWTRIVAGQFDKANLLFYDDANRVGEFYTVSRSGDIQLIEGWS
jgi:hypothetical protein